MTRKVLLIGDACLDVYIFVHTKRKNPEVDRPLYTETDRLSTGGMARNVLKCLKALGLEVTAIMPQALSEKVRILDTQTGETYCRIDNDVIVEPVNLEEVDFSQYQAVVISDYDKGFVTENTILEVQNRFHGPIFLDTKKRFLNKFSKCLIKINHDEYLRVLSEIPEKTVVTEGAKGAFIIGPFSSVRVPGIEVNAVDTCGAGDVFLAGYVFGYLDTFGNVPAAVEYGNILAANSVKVRGVPANTKEVIYTELNKM